MKDPLDLIKRLGQGPAILFFGQNYLRLESGQDTFLTNVLSKFGLENPASQDYKQILNGTAQNDADSSLAWMHQRSERIAIPGWLRTVASYGWSHVYTSAIDTVWYRAFRSDIRDPQPIFEEKYKPLDPRNKYELHCTFLFGCVNRTEIMERPPLKKMEWLRRKQEAITLARRLPELVTPFGVLVIEGYDAISDWFAADDLIPILNDLGVGQIHIFSATKDKAWINDFLDLEALGKTTLYDESLAAYLLRAQEAGSLELGLRPGIEEEGWRIQVADKTLYVPPELWRQVSHSATILSDGMFIASKSSSPEHRYTDFRNFLAASSDKPVWSGYKKGFAFRRFFEKSLYSHVQNALEARILQDKPIILHGQSGIGKTVALGALVYDIRQEAKYPAIFIERRSQRPSIADLDLFCQWAEDNGAAKTIIVWDGMLDMDQYTEMLGYLAGRGRKVVLVGSCYRLNNDQVDEDSCVLAPAEMLPNESQEFMTFLSTLEPNLEKFIQSRIDPTDASFLVALYRLLPGTRQALASRLDKEAAVAEREINTRTRENNIIATTALGYAMLQANLISRETLFSGEVGNLDGEPVTEIQELIWLIMVPGQFGLKVPLELLLRAIRKEWLANFVDLISDIDLFRWDEDNVGNPSIGPRHALEADLIVKSRLGDAQAEVAYIQQLLREIKGENLNDNSDINFAIDLMVQIGPNSKFSSRFSPYYVRISETLTKLRNERGLQNPRLMLQEAFLLREYWQRQNDLGTSEGMSPIFLERAETILRSALDLLHDDRRSARLHGYLLVELAATLAAKTRHSLRSIGEATATLQLFRDTRGQVFRAIAGSPEDFHPLDILYLLTDHIIKGHILDENSEAESKADLLSLFSAFDPESLDYEQRKRFYERNYLLGDMLSKVSISDSAFDSLLALGSKAGYLLKALTIAGVVATKARLTPDEQLHCREAAAYLQSHRKAISDDFRCLYALLRYWWMSRTGKPIFFEERQTAPFNNEDWHFVSELLRDLNSSPEAYSKPHLIYLQGLSEFHLGSVNNSITIFRNLEREADYMRGRRRIIRSYLASNPDGSPREFNASVNWTHDDGSKGEVYVEELRSRIRFIPYEFGRRLDFHQGQSLGKIHIAFNFIGPVADPVGYLKTDSSRRQ